MGKVTTRNFHNFNALETAPRKLQRSRVDTRFNDSTSCAELGFVDLREPHFLYSFQCNYGPLRPSIDQGIGLRNSGLRLAQPRRLRAGDS